MPKLTPARLRAIQALVLVVGFAMMTLAIAAYEWRIGLLFLGAGLVASTQDLRR